MTKKIKIKIIEQFQYKNKFEDIKHLFDKPEENISSNEKHMLYSKNKDNIPFTFRLDMTNRPNISELYEMYSSSFTFSGIFDFNRSCIVFPLFLGVYPSSRFVILFLIHVENVLVSKLSMV